MRVLLAVVFIVIFIVPAVAIDDKIADRLWESSKVVDELIQAPDSEIPKPLLKRAECVAVIPGLKKAALGFGGQLGRGAVSCKKNAGNGPFGPPAMISITGGSFADGPHKYGVSTVSGATRTREKEFHCCAAGGCSSSWFFTTIGTMPCGWIAVFRTV